MPTTAPSGQHLPIIEPDCKSAPLGDLRYNANLRRRRGQSFVYFIGPEDRGLGRVKIGFTKTTPEERKASLQTGSPFPLEVYACFAGTLEDERRLHDAFEIWRSHNEWFYHVGPVAEFIDLLTLLSSNNPASRGAACAVAKEVGMMNWRDEVDARYFGGFPNNFPKALNAWKVM